MNYKVAIVIPVYQQFSELESFEKISLEQTFKVLHPYDICFVTHSKIDITPYHSKFSNNCNIKRFNFKECFFENITGYNRLLLNYNFYKTFVEYSHILICQLDVFIFSDKLEYFINLSYDYIGGPWFEGYGLATKESKIIGGGNGGLSLRKVSSFLYVLGLSSLFKKPFFSFRGIEALLKKPSSYISIVKYRISRNTDLNFPVFPWQFLNNEDIYWGDRVKILFPWFNVGSIEDSISFSFEVNPEILYNLNNNQLPMGAHAWQKYNYEFWKPHIKCLGYL